MRARSIDFALLALLITAIAIAGAAAKAADSVPPVTTASPVAVIIRNSVYYPASVTIKPGQTVTWRNDDVQYSHTVTSTKNLFSSGNMDRGVVWSYTFAKPGTYPYTCKYHPFMQGTVIVEGGSPAPGGATTAPAAPSPAGVGTAAPTTNPGGY